MPTSIICNMAHASGSGAINVPNVRGWGVEPASLRNEEQETWDLWVVFFAAGDVEILRRRITITNTRSTKLSRNPAATALENLIVVTDVATPGGFTAIAAAGGNSKAARQRNLAEALLTLGVVANVAFGDAANVSLHGPTS